MSYLARSLSPVATPTEPFRLAEIAPMPPLRPIGLVTLSANLHAPGLRFCEATGESERAKYEKRNYEITYEK